MSEGKPTVTVVVPTRDRAAFLSDLVAALKAQTHAAFEVVFVDDASTDGTSAAIAAAANGDERFRVVQADGRGPAAARNAGCRDVRTSWIAFTDDDCLPQPDWVRSLLVAVDRDGAEVVQGRTEPEPGDWRGQRPWFVRTQRISAWSGRFQTCNLLVPTASFHAVGGFDETFPPDGFGEDTDLGLRLVASGASTAFAPDALVRHRVLGMGVAEHLRRRYRWSKVVHLVAVNPEARQIFPHPYVSRWSHVRFWAALPVAAATARARRYDLLAIAGVAYSGYRAARTRDRNRPVVVRMGLGALEPVGLAVSAVGFLVESIRKRRLLL